MTKPLQVGITGGIGAGKSIICKIFGVLGIPIYDADSKAKLLMQNNKELQQQIIKLFGPDSYTDGQLNRSYLAERVFNNSQNVKQLNQIVHPAVARDYGDWYSDQSQQTAYVVREAALMIESGSYRDLDSLITVEAPRSLRISRVQQRDPHRSKQQIEAIISKQLTDEQRLQYAHYVIQNDEMQLVVPQVLKLHQLFLGQ